MRDIRGDLQERANLLTQQMSAMKSEFERLLEQLKAEHHSKISTLTSELQVVTRVLEIEDRRLRSAVPEPQTKPLTAA